MKHQSALIEMKSSAGQELTDRAMVPSSGQMDLLLCYLDEKYSFCRTVATVFTQIYEYAIYHWLNILF